MKLTDQELNSSCWIKLSGHLCDLLDKSRSELEKTSLSIEETHGIRYRVKLIRQLLSLADKRPTMIDNRKAIED